MGKKDSYGGSGKRQYDRHSGTGQNTFNKYEKKGGTGKGNWGSENTEVPEESKEANANAENDQPQEPVEPVLTLDDYLKDNSAMNLEYQVQEEDMAKIDIAAEKGLKVHKTKEADYVEANT